MQPKDIVAQVLRVCPLADKWLSVAPIPDYASEIYLYM